MEQQKLSEAKQKLSKAEQQLALAKLGNPRLSETPPPGYQGEPGLASAISKHLRVQQKESQRKLQGKLM